MEDTTDKIRRNLVAVAALMLLSALLEISVSQIIDKLAGASILDPMRANAAYLAVLAYCLIRYRNSSYGQTYQSGYKKLAHGAYHGDVSAYVTAKIASLPKSWPHSHALFPKLQMELSLEEVVAAETLEASEVWLEARAVEAESNKLDLRTATVDVFCRTPGDGVLKTFSRKATVYDLGWRQPLFLLWAILRTVFYSPVGLESFVPVLMAACAMLIPVTRIAGAYWAV